MNPVARALLVTILIAGLLGGSLWLLVPDRSGLRGPALAFFETWWKGEPTDRALAKAFDGAASKSAFEEMRTKWQATLGTYDGPGEVVSESSDAQRGSIVILLNFENGSAEGHFDFISTGDLWKLKNFRLEPKTGALAGGPKGEAELFPKGLVKFWATERWRTVWEMFEPNLRNQFPPEAFEQRTNELLLELGALQEVKVISQGREDEATLNSELSGVFEKGTRNVTMTLIWIGGQWRITAFAIEGWED